MRASSRAKKRSSPEATAPADLLAHENAAWKSGVFRVAGVDEAGRGPLAGPVVAAAVAFPPLFLQHGIPPELATVNDSKKLSAPARERLFEKMRALPQLSIGVCVLEAAEIDRLDILRATHRAMAGALEQIDPLPELALVDGLPVPGLPCPSHNLVKGDARCFSIAAASIIAKVTRDRIMLALDAEYPAYGFARHKGYGTAVHLAALRKYGPCPAHRQSFAPVATLAQEDLFPLPKSTFRI